MKNKQLSVVPACSDYTSQIVLRNNIHQIYALSGEVVSGIALAVFFTLFLSNLNTISSLAFYLCITTLVLALILSLCYFWPKYIKLFRDLNAIKE